MLWSKDSIASEWVKGEAAAAVQRGVLVPALIDNVKLPLEFSRRQTADLIGWEGDTSQAGFQALCDGITGTAGMTPRSTSDASENRQAARDSWNQRWVLKGWWQTLPGVLMASAVFLAALAALVAALNQARTPKTDLTSTPQPGQSTQPPGSPEHKAANQRTLLLPLPHPPTGTNQRGSFQTRLGVWALERTFPTTTPSTLGLELSRRSSMARTGGCSFG